MQIGQCCVDQVMSPPVVSVSGGLNETIPFTNVSSLIILHNATRKARFGDALVIHIYINGEDGVPRLTSVEVIPNSLINPTVYTADFGGVSSGHAILT